MQDQEATRPDVAAILDAIRQQVRQQRSAAPSVGEPAFPEIELRHILQEIEAARAISAHWPLQGQSLPQRAIAFINRLVRRYLRWYINPIVEQQNAYNDVLARALHGMVAANEELRAEVALLRSRLNELEGWGSQSREDARRSEKRDG